MRAPALGTGAHVHVSLARTAAWLLDHADDPQGSAAEWDG
jgi:hypothetical protein